MKPPRRPLPTALVVCLLIFANLQSSLACTIFVLTDRNRTLFANNEDWSNPRTRVWFIPAIEKHFGAVYVGFDDGAQGGMNTEGLAWDWVAGFDDVWQPDPGLTNVWGNSSQQMLETCATVEEAIAFYRSHREMSFRRARILVADRTGASVIIGAKDGKLLVETANQCRGFGYGNETLDKMLAKSAEPTVGNGFKILRACMQKGEYATKYSNVFDLKSGDIFLRSFSDGSGTHEVKLTLAAELKKGAHYYDMAQIREQLAQARAARGRIERHGFENRQNVLLDGQASEDRRLLRQVPDALAGPDVHRIFGDVQAIELDTTRIGRCETDGHVKGRGLARAIGPEQSDDLT